jgi:hypothetical protein
MLDPAYSEELEQLKKNINNASTLYYDQMAKIEKMKKDAMNEYKRMMSQEYDFIRDHPSLVELERRACIAQLKDEWIVTDDPLTCSYFMIIGCIGFPRITLIPKKGKMDDGIPQIALNLQRHGFEVSIKRRKVDYY